MGRVGFCERDLLKFAKNYPRELEAIVGYIKRNYVKRRRGHESRLGSRGRESGGSNRSR